MQVGQLLDAIKHRLGGPVAPELGGGVRVVNDAGSLFYSLHAWKHALRASTLISVTAGDTSLVVPVDFKGLIAVRKTGNPWRGSADVGPRDLLSFRTINIPPFNMDITNVEPDSTQPSGWRIGIYPPIAATEAGAYTMDYVATWVDKAKPEDVVTCARFAEPALIHLVREYAAGLEMNDLDRTLANYTKGLVFQAAIKADGSSQDTLGHMTGGAVENQAMSDMYAWMNTARMT